MTPDTVISHHISSGPSTKINVRARKICTTFDHNIKDFRFNLSASNPLIGWEIPNKIILTENNMPSRNSEPEYSNIRRNKAIVLNHSPSK